MLKLFANDESGAITVDWVVLTASLVGIAIAVLLVIAGGLNTASGNIEQDLSTSGSVANLIGAAQYSNLSGFTEGESHNGHTHYYDAQTNDRYRLEPDGNFYDNSNTLVGSVNGDGDIVPPASS